VYPGSNVALSFPSTVPPGASILYTNDGTVPDPSNPSSLVYAGPILINTSVTLLAVTIAAGYTRSNIAGGTYTPGNPCGVTPVVIFNTLSQTQSNDFLLSLSSAPSGKTICYTLDGSNATCTKGGCTGVSVTYDAVSQIPIDGMETNTQTGLVSVVAIACTPGFWSCPSSNLQEEQYTLAAAAPSIVNLSSGDGGTSSPDAGVSLVLDTATKSTASPANPVSIHYTTGGGPPSCTTGTSVTPPYTLSGLPSTTTVQAIACKTGYLPSSVTSWP
jgi:hypothetical protein